MNYLRNSLRELRYVKWPTAKQALSYTILILIVTALVALLLGASDFGFTELVRSLI